VLFPVGSIILASTENSATNQPPLISESSAFEGISSNKTEKLAPIHTQHANTNAPLKESSSWQMHWDNGLLYQLTIDQPRWAQLYLNTKENTTILDGKTGLRLDINGTIYDENKNIPNVKDQIFVRRANIYTAGYFFFLVPEFYKFEAEIADGKFYLRDAFIWLDEVPLVGTLKFGHFTTPSTLDNLTSSRDRLFIETPAPVEAFSQGSKLGVQISDSTKHKKATGAIGIFGNGDSFDISDATHSNSRLIWRFSWMPTSSGSSILAHLGYHGSFIIPASAAPATEPGPSHI
jgi:phosphate-selective porin